MQIVTAKPPNFAEILRAFPHAADPWVIFTFGPTIYNPSGGPISAAIKCHESVHAQRQGPDETAWRAWWHRYIDEPLFRLEEELLAHRAEYRAALSWTKDRNARERHLHHIASRMAGPLYGSLLSYREARHFIAADVQ